MFIFFEIFFMGFLFWFLYNSYKKWKESPDNKNVTKLNKMKERESRLNEDVDLTKQMINVKGKIKKESEMLNKLNEKMGD